MAVPDPSALIHTRMSFTRVRLGGPGSVLGLECTLFVLCSQDVLVLLARFFAVPEESRAGGCEKRFVAFRESL